MKYLSLLQAVFNNSFSINLSPFVRQAIDAEDAEVWELLLKLQHSYVVTRGWQWAASLFSSVGS